jgi:hypothetical protein
MKISLIFAAALLAAQTCGTGAKETMLTMKLTTDGGITGRGLGAVTVDATQNADAPRVEATDTRKNCTGALTPEERSRLRNLLNASRPDLWQHEYSAPSGSADLIHYTLTVGDRTTSWYGESPVELPQDARDLRAALWTVRDRVIRDCK